MGPGVQTPPSQIVAVSQYVAPQSWPSIAHAAPVGRTAEQVPRTGGHASHSSHDQRLPVHAKGPNGAASVGLGQQSPHSAPSTSHGWPATSGPHSAAGQSHLGRPPVRSHVHSPLGGGPQHVGGQRSGGIVPGGQTHSPPSHTAMNVTSPPQ
jgi:hypothetical protein